MDMFPLWMAFLDFFFNFWVGMRVVVSRWGFRFGCGHASRFFVALYGRTRDFGCSVAYWTMDHNVVQMQLAAKYFQSSEPTWFNATMCDHMASLFTIVNQFCICPDSRWTINLGAIYNFLLLVDEFRLLDKRPLLILVPFNQGDGRWTGYKYNICIVCKKQQPSNMNKMCWSSTEAF